MGEVFRARDNRLGREVAVKVIAAEGAGSPARLQRFEQEAKALAALDHPHILAVHDVGTHNGTAYVVFELLDGETLRQRLERGALTARKTVELAVQICRGLGAAHAQGIVHRDLKPENLFLTKDGRLKILDFGLAKLTDHLNGSSQPSKGTATEPGLLLGTVGYMSPEQARGRPADARSDIFSLGAILYEMLSGRRAFGGETAADTLAAILARDPPEMTGGPEPIPPALEHLVSRCLDKQPEERFQSAHDLALALEAVSTAAPTRGSAISDAVSRGRWLRLVALMAVLVAAALLVVSWAARPERPPLLEYKRLTFRRGMVLDARFTPDGHTVVYSALWEGAPAETYSARVEGRQAVSLGLPPARVWGVSRQGELAIVLAKPGEKTYSWRGTLARVPLSGGVPREVAEDVWAADWSPDGRELAALRLVNGAWQIEYPIGRVIVRPVTNVSDGGLAFRVSPRGDKIAYITYDSFAIVDRDGKPVPLPKGLPNSVGLAWDPSGDAIWVAGTTAMGTSIGLWRIGLDGTVREVTRWPGDGMLHDVSTDGRVLFHNGVELVGARARAPGDTVERDVPVFNWTGRIHITDDGEQLLLHDQSDPPAGWSLLRPTRGGPPVRLGEGVPIAVSRDGKTVVVDQGVGSVPKLVLMPTGPGDTRVLPTGTLKDVIWGWFPDANHLLLNCGPGMPSRTFLLDLASGALAAVTPEGTFSVRGSGDDGFVLAVARDRSMAWHPLHGGQSRGITAQLPDNTFAIAMSADRASVYVGERGVPGRLDRLDLATGRRIPWKTLQPDDPAGFVGVIGFAVTPDGSAYAYRYLRFLQDLYVVENLR